MTVKAETPLREAKARLPFGEEEQERLQALAVKIDQDAPFSVAVCGHFSAGKSTLLNHLLGANLLPSSPIPTTANIMTIKAGEPGVAARSNQGNEQEYKGEIPWEKLQSMAVDGEGIREIELSLPLPYLHEGVELADTPGMDSTDETHGKYTAHELLTTDAVIYVTDYNHVRSQTNIRFLRQMQRENKPIVLVVNQIDKHDENELAFSIFKHGLRDMLQRFGIEPVRVYFTSGRALDHPHNDLETFISETRSWLFHAPELKNLSQERMVKSAVSALRERLLTHREQIEKDLKKVLEDHGFSQSDHQRMLHAQEELRTLEHQYSEEVEMLRHHLDEFFRQTHLFPHSATELTKEWLKTLAKDYKVSFFQSRKKKAAIQAEKREALQENICRRWNTEVCVHLTELFKKETLSHQLMEDIQATTESLPCPAEDAEWLETFIPEGEKSNTFVYHLTAQVNKAMLQTIKPQIEQHFEEIIIEKQEQMKGRSKELTTRLEKYEKVKEIEMKHRERTKVVSKEIEEVDDYLQIGISDQDLETGIIHAMERTVGLGGVASDIHVSEGTETKKEEKQPSVEKQQPDKKRISPLPDSAQMKLLEDIMDTFTAVSYAQKERETLLRYVQELKRDTYTFVLSGAFSAGKSTFLNALLQAEIMPASPHPTTASLTTVTSSNDEYAHGTAVVRIKNAQDLDEEIQDVAYACGMTYNLESLKEAEGLSIKKTDTLEEKQWLEYLRALLLGVKKEQYTWGGVLTMSLTEWQEIAAKEDHACLIEQATVYYDSEITQKGWRLVDTPGVQSVHERHTRLAESEIEKADAFLYLTYYHHAFSEADRTFITKLKDVHPPDYFIINASDLAFDEQERLHVFSHVQEQLASIGCQETIPFSLSSKQALHRGGDEGFADFLHHMEKKAIPYLRYKKYIDVRESINELIAALMKTEKLLQKPLTIREEKAKIEEERLLTSQKELDASNLFKRLAEGENEVQAWKAYAERRLQLAFEDAYKESIHPAAVDGENNKDRREALEKALDVFFQKCKTLWQDEQKQFKKKIAEDFENKKQMIYERIRTVFGEVPEVIETGTINTEMETRFKIEAEKINQLTTKAKIKKSFFFDGENDRLKQKVFNELEEKIQEVLDRAAEEMHSLRKQMLSTTEKSIQHAWDAQVKRRKEQIHFYRQGNPDIDGLQKEINELQQWLEGVANHVEKEKV